MLRYHQRLWFRLLLVTAMLVVSLLPSIEWRRPAVVAAGLPRLAVAALAAARRAAQDPAPQLRGPRLAQLPRGHLPSAGLTRLADDVGVLAGLVVRAVDTVVRGWGTGLQGITGDRGLCSAARGAGDTVGSSSLTTCATRSAVMLRRAAVSLARRARAVEASSRGLAARVAQAPAVTAMVHHLVRLLSNMLGAGTA